MDINNTQLITHIRRALHHLYDLDELRRNPLVELFGIERHVDSGAKLQKILLDTIEALHPDDEESPQSIAWMIYDILFYRYVRGYTRQAVANQLGISDRQLSRKQCTALETLASNLWKTYGIDNNSQPVNFDATWLENLPLEKQSDWKPVLQGVLDMLQSLTQKHAAKIILTINNGEKDILVPQMVLRYALLNILGRVIPLSAHRSFLLSTAASEQGLTITIQVPQSSRMETSLYDTILRDQNIEVARQFVEQAKGKLTITTEGDNVQIQFTIPAGELIPVLVIDDNADIIQLFKRYAQGTCYSIIGVQNPTEGFELISKIHPPIIIIDVMMPNQDGWDLLTRLCQESPTEGQPKHPCRIIVCSILPQESLALSLGASGFLQKPVLPYDFLRMLDEQKSHLLRE